MHTNYRESHVDTGRDYHDKFLHGPYRPLIWHIEQAALLEIVAAHRARGLGSVGMLDFACGTGRILGLLEGHVDSAVGVDVSESMLEVARSHLSKVDLLHVDLTRDDALAGRRFELITAFRFFPNAEPALREEAMRALAGLLAEDGILVFNNHLRCSGSKMRMRRLRARIRTKKNTAKDLHCMADAEVEALVAGAGLRVLEIHPMAYLPVLKEKRPLLPKAVLSALEHWALGRSSLAELANSRIYVLGHAEGSTGR